MGPRWLPLVVVGVAMVAWVAPISMIRRRAGMPIGMVPSTRLGWVIVVAAVIVPTGFIVLAVIR